MVTTSYPRFPGDSVGTFMEPIARSMAARGHKVHVVAPWHPLVSRRRFEEGVHFHFYKYAPLRSLNVFGYAAAMKADVSLRAAAVGIAPLALAAGWRAALRVARKFKATVVHGHWVVPGGVMAAAAAGGRPLVISLHGSDVYVAERIFPARVAARWAFRRASYVTACSGDLARRATALGADPRRLQVIPYGVDPQRFRPEHDARAKFRERAGIPPDAPVVAAAGRLVRKKGFEYLIDAMSQVQGAILAIAGDGTLLEELRRRAVSLGIAERMRFLGNRSQDEVGALFAAADVIVTPSIRDDAGNVDGLPNVVMEALSSGTLLVTTTAGGIGAVVEDEKTALVVPERDPAAIGRALKRAVADPGLRSRIGAAARTLAKRSLSWDRTAAEFEEVYRRALAFKSIGR